MNRRSTNNISPSYSTTWIVEDNLEQFIVLSTLSNRLPWRTQNWNPYIVPTAEIKSHSSNSHKPIHINAIKVKLKCSTHSTAPSLRTGKNWLGKKRRQRQSRESGTEAHSCESFSSRFASCPLQGRKEGEGSSSEWPSACRTMTELPVFFVL